MNLTHAELEEVRKEENDKLGNRNIVRVVFVINLWKHTVSESRTIGHVNIFLTVHIDRFGLCEVKWMLYARG